MLGLGFGSSGPADVYSLPVAIGGVGLEVIAVLGSSAPARMAASFLLVLGFGAAVLYYREDLVNSSVERSMANPLVSLVYGVMAYVLVSFLGGYALTQLGQLNVGGGVFRLVGGLVTVAALLVLGGLGFVVVGSKVTELRGERRPWLGLVVGATVSGLLLALPVFPGVAAWIAVAAAGIGGPTRHWVHDSRGVEDEA